MSRRDAYLTAAMPTLRSLEALEREGLLSPDPRLEAAAQSMAIAVTPEMAALIDRADFARDPIARQFVPSAAEAEVSPQELADPIGDEFRSPVKGIVHRYPDRVLLKPLHVCPVYCRFCFRREKVGPGGEALSAEELDAGREFARYKDLDGDGIPYRTWPGTHPDKGAYFTRGTSRNPQAIYSERGPDYVYNMERLLRKWDTAKSLVPQPVVAQSDIPAKHGAIYFGSTSPAMAEAVVALREDGIALDTLRLRAFPFPDSVRAFIDAHESVFVVEQNRDGQLRSLLVNEFGIDPARLLTVLHYDGTPITARFIAGAISERIPASFSLREKVAHSAG